MLLQIEHSGFGGRWGNRPKHVDVLTCDTCHKTYVRKHRKDNDTTLTFCSKSCSARNLILSETKKQTCLQRYGVEFVSQIFDVKQKKHLTKKLNRTYGKSYAEDSCYAFLCDRYGLSNIERQVTVNGWSIDFHVQPQTWIQFDGIYWHGLNKPYQELAQYQRRVYDKDRAQDLWFHSRGMRLVRITDMELIGCRRSSDWTNIEAKFGAT